MKRYSALLFDILDSLRGRSEATRWAVVISLTAISTAGLLVLFAWDVNQNLAQISQPRQEDESSLATLLSPFQSLSRSIAAIRAGENPEDVAARLRAEQESLRAKSQESRSGASDRTLMGAVLDGLRNAAGRALDFVAALAHPLDLLEKKIQSE